MALDILIVNDWGSMPNVRVFYIASFLEKKGCKVELLGRKLEYIPDVYKDVIFVDVLFHRDNEFLRSFLKHMIVRIQLLFFATRLIIKKKPRFLMLRSFYMTLLLLCISRICGCRIIYDCHGFFYKELYYKNQYHKSIFIKFFEKFLLSKVDFVITISKHLREEMYKYKPVERVFLIPNAIDLRAFYGISENHIILRQYSIPLNIPLAGFIGNWERWINIEELLQASRFLRDAKIVIVGSGPKIDYYKKKYHDVIFTGRVPYIDAINLLKGFAICILPYSNDPIMKEKSARKTYEYMAAGKPIIVNKVIGKEDFLVDGRNCLTYESRNPKDLAERINELLEDKELMQKIGENNKELVREFTWAKIIKKSGLLEIFGKLGFE